MSNERQLALHFFEQNQNRYLEELIEYCSIPSISTDPEHEDDIKQAAQWSAQKLRSIGMQNVQIIPTDRHPIVYGEHLKAGPDAPTALLYGHYDVQPADPLDLWETGPFEPQVRGENLYARGASDMKGQNVVCFNAVEAVLQTSELPINVKFLLEGEEEIGSPSIEAFFEKHKNMLACDVSINPDAGMLGATLPTINYALRGLAYFEINVQGPAIDLHSGMSGGIVVNPAYELARLIGGMIDEKGRITLPGFYDRVRPMDAEERAELTRLPKSDKDFLKDTGAPMLWGEEGYTPIERVGGRPSLDVNGFLSGFTGPGTKTVIPAKAMAKVSMRLVPDQDPEEVYRQLSQYLEENANPGVTWEVDLLNSASASISSRDSIYAQAISEALETVWGTRPVFNRVGGSVPIVGDMQRILGVDSVLTGFGLPDDAIHSPNEKLHLPTWRKGTQAFIHMLFNLAQ
jgi:acetylornithine deacetylase/succinyl-diaminopimelate desuccinylase-like protein